MKKTLLCVLTCLVMHLCFTTSSRADEGMWMINNLSARTDSVLKSLGLELTHEQIYSPDAPALNNAIVMFGGFCSGVVVSPEGLVFTNHHCGYGSIQEHSTTKNDYLTYGFFAKTYKEELPNPDLYVAFHLRTVDVSDKMFAAVTPEMDESTRATVLDSVADVLKAAVEDSVHCVYGEIVPYYKGSKYYLSVYQRYNDVRLVFAPPQSLGKFGGDTDNWVWPRQTCDFSVFRIYADANNQPAEYDVNNKPYKPISYAHVSTQGYQPGSYCMTFGYPGSTDRYLSSYGIWNTMRTTNDIRIQVRGVKQDILKAAMNSSDEIRIKYASTYASSSNYWKYSIGQNKALEDLGVIAEKQALEKEVTDWINADLASRGQYAGVLDSLKVQYEQEYEQSLAVNLMEESFWNGSNILNAVLSTMMHVMRGSEYDMNKELTKAYKDIDVATDKKVFAAMLRNYREHAPNKSCLLETYAVIDSLLNGDCDQFTDLLYSKSLFADPEKVLAVESLAEIVDDPMFEFATDVISTLYRNYSGTKTEANERKLGEAIRLMNKDKEYYPDANFTLRMSFGIVEGYSPSKELTYNHFTDVKSFTDKVEKFPDNDDYKVIPEVYNWMKKGDFGKRYLDKSNGELQLCFLTNNDITGGNSGSGMFDGKGRLIGLAFDGNWEAMSSDLKFNNELTRCIGVDIRFVLSVIDNYGKGKRLIKELTLE